MQKGIAPILIVVFIALILGGFLIYQKQTKPVTPVQQTIQPSPAKADEIANWQIYSDINFSVKYPGDWKVNNVGLVSFFNPASAYSITNSDGMKLDEYREYVEFSGPFLGDPFQKAVELQQYLKQRGIKDIHIRKVKINGLDAVVHDYVERDQLGQGYVFLIANSKTYITVYSSVTNPNGEDIENQILSTFKFTQ